MSVAYARFPSGPVVFTPLTPYRCDWGTHLLGSLGLSTQSLTGKRFDFDGHRPIVEHASPLSDRLGLAGRAGKNHAPWFPPIHHYETNWFHKFPPMHIIDLLAINCQL